MNCASTCGQCADVLGCSNIDGHCQTGCRRRDSMDNFVKKVRFLQLKNIKTLFSNIIFNKTILKLEIYYIKTVFFIEECAIGTYGLNCTMVCDQCREMSDCSNVNGICGSGCNPGYIGLNCKEGLRCFVYIYCNTSKALTNLSVY